MPSPSAAGVLLTGASTCSPASRADACWSSTTRSIELIAPTPPSRPSSRASYATQRLVYALAALHAGAEQVEVAYCFLEAPEAPVTAVYLAAERAELQARLEALADGVLERRFGVSEIPHRGLCAGCPAEGGLCSWPLEMTRREAPDRLF